MVWIAGFSFTGQLTLPDGAIVTPDEAHSVHAYSAVATITATSFVTGALWRLTLDGADFAYAVKDGDTIDLVASGLATAINRGPQASSPLRAAAARSR